MARKISMAAMVLLVIVGALLITGEWSVHRRSEEVCGICARHINERAGVIAEVGGVRHHVCCAHCAVTEGFQEHKPVKLIEVTDYSTGRKLDPTKAWYVDGSRVVACEHDMTHMSETKQAAPAMFDRCSPGTFAFADQTQAKDFVAANGGVVRNMEEMLAGVNAGEAKQ
ncbi:MAG TPA: hypothetical protein VLC51_02205 [Nitrospira sp.]|nr:hypothetical protein [Nitrospira sp.]